MSFKQSLLLIPIVAGGLATNVALASDHDDGELSTHLKDRSLGLTDLHVFREDWQKTGGSAEHLIFAMSTNPRSLPKQHYFFSTNARYEFHISRAKDKNTAPNGANDITMRFEFSEPEDFANGKYSQNVTMTLIVDGAEYAATTTKGTSTNIKTTAYGIGASAAPTVVNNEVELNGQTFNVFAGMRQDPFSFDVKGYFRLRSTLAQLGVETVKGGASGAIGAALTKGTVFTGDDFTKDYNVNQIVVRVPIAALKGTDTTVFDVWETISYKAK